MKTISRHLMGIILAVVILFGGGVLMSFGATQTSNRNLEVYSAGGTGTANDPYLIGTVDELNTTLRDNASVAGTYFKLTADINLNTISNWTPIPLLASGSVLDGNGKTISNLASGSGDNRGFFANLNGTVKNLNFSNVNFSGTGSNRGVIAGVVRCTTDTAVVDAKIENVKVLSGNVTGTNYIGGFVGYMGTSSSPTNSSADNLKLTITASYNSANVGPAKGGYVGLYAGGLVCYVHRGTVVVNACYNTGDVSVENSSWAVLAAHACYAGGIVGYITTNSDATISNCFNMGTIHIQQGANGTNSHGGGILGAAVSNSTASITSCANTGETTGNAATNNFTKTIYGITEGNSTVEVEDSYSTTGVGGSGDNEELIYEMITEIGELITELTSSLVTPPTSDGSYTFSTNHVSYSVEDGGSFTFSITLAESHNLIAPTVYVNGSVFTGSQVGETDEYAYVISDIRENKVISVTTTLNNYTVVKTTADNTTTGGAAHFTYSGVPTNVSHGSALSFSLVMDEGYNVSAPAVTVGGTAVVGTRDGSNLLKFNYNVASITNLFANASGQISVVVAPVINTYTVTRPASGVGYTTSSDDSGTVNHGSSYTFRVTVAETAYDKNSLVVKVNQGASDEQTLTGTQPGDLNGTRTYEFVISNVTSDKLISISVSLNTYAVLKTTAATNFTYGAMPSTVQHGQAFNFTITTTSAYNQVAPKAYANGALLTSTYVSGNTWSYAVLSTMATEDISITVALTENAYNVVLDATAVGIASSVAGTSPVLHTAGVYQFTVTLSPSHRAASPDVVVSGGTVSLAVDDSDAADGIYVYTASGITNHINITVTATINTYTVTRPNGNLSTLGFGTTAVSESNIINYGGSYTFNVTVNTASHKASTLAVSVNKGLGDEQLLEGTQPGALEGTNVWQFTIANIQSNKAITIAVSLNTYSVSIGDKAGTSTNGLGNPTTVQHGAGFTFDIEVLSGYTNSTPLAKANGTALATPVKTGNIYTFAVPASLVTGSIAIVIENVSENIYNVTLPAGSANLGYTTSGAGTATYGTAYTFVVNLLDSHKNLNVSVAGCTVELTQQTGSSYTYSVTGFNNHFTVVVSADRKDFALTAQNGTGYSFADLPAGNKIYYQTPFTFKLVVAANYNQSAPVVLANLTLLSDPTLSIADGVYTYTYTVPAAVIIDDVEIFVDEVNLNTFAVTRNGGVGTVSTSGASIVTYGDTSYSFEITVLNSYSTVAPEIAATGWTVGSIALKDGFSNIYVCTITKATGADAALVINISPKLNVYTLTAQDTEKYEFDNLPVDNKIQHGVSFTFDLMVNEGYTQSSPVVKIGSTTLTDFVKNGNTYTYTVAAGLVTGDITLLVSGVESNTYAVSIVLGEGIATAAGSVGYVIHGESYTFDITLLASHSETAPTITPPLGWSIVGDVTKQGDVYTCTIATVGGAIEPITINVSGTRNVYDLDKEDDTGYSFVNLPVDNKIQHGISFTFDLVVQKGYNQSVPKVYADANLLSNPVPAITDGIYTYTYSVPAAYIVGDMTLTADLIVANTYSVSIPTGAGFEITGPATATYLTQYSFTLDIFTAYTNSVYTTTVKVDGEVVTPSVAGKVYTISAASVTGDIEILISGVVKNVYSITTGVQSGYTITGLPEVHDVPNRIEHGNSFSFDIAVAPSHNQSVPKITVKVTSNADSSITSTVLTNPSAVVANGYYTYSYTFAGDLVVGNVEIIVENINDNRYSVTLNAGVGVSLLSGENYIVHGAGYTFTINLNTSHNKLAPTISLPAGYSIDTLELVDEGVPGVYTCTISKAGGADGAITIGATATRNTYGVTITDTLTGDDNGTSFVAVTTFPAVSTHGYAFAFTITMQSPYQLDEPAVSINYGAGVTLDGTKTGGSTWTYTIIADYTIQDLAITVDPTLNVYDVTLPSGTGITSALGEATVEHGDTYTLKITLANSHSAAILGLTPSSGTLSSLTSAVVDGATVWTAVVDNVTDDLTFAISGLNYNIYSVTKPATTTGYTLTANDTATHGSPYSFTVVLDNDYSQNEGTLNVSVDAGTLTLTSHVAGTNVFVYTVTDIVSAFEISVGALAQNQYNFSITQPTGGTITADKAVGTYYHGEEIEITITPTTGGGGAFNYIVVGIIINGVEYAIDGDANLAPSDYSIILTQDTTISARLVAGNVYLFDMTTPTSDATYTFDSNYSNRVYQGEEYVFTITLDDAYSRSQFSVKAEGSNRDETLTKTLISGNIYEFVIENVQENLTIVVSGIVPNSYGITLPQGGTAILGYETETTDPVTVAHNGTFEFTVTVYTSHNEAAPQVTIGGTALDYDSVADGASNTKVYTYIIEDIVDDIVIAIAATRNTYTVSLPAGNLQTLGYTTSRVSGSDIVEYGATYTFDLTVNTAAYNAATLKIYVNGSLQFTTAEGAIIEAGKTWRFNITNITEAQVVTVSIDLNKYDVLKQTQEKGFTYTSVPNDINHGEGFNVQITLDENYSINTPVVKVSIGGVVTTLSNPVITGGGLVYTYAVSGNIVTSDVSVIVEVQPNGYTVVLPPGGSGLGFNAEGVNTATYGVDYVFTVTTQVSHNQNAPNVSVVSGGTLSDPTRDGNEYTYTIAGASITGNITISISPVLNEYEVRIANNPIIGFSASLPAGNKAYHGTAFTFTVTLEYGYTGAAPEANIGVNYLAQVENLGNNVYRFTVPGNIVVAGMPITVHVTKTMYTITASSGVGYSVTSPTTIRYLTGFDFSVAIDPSHSESDFVVKVNGTTIEGVAGVYSVAAGSVTGNMSIAVEGVEINTYTAQIESDYSGKFTSSYTTAQTIYHGTSFSFTITLSYGYTDSTVSAKISLDGENYVELGNPEKSGNNYTFSVPAESVTGDLSIEILEPVKNTYNITSTSGAGYEVDSQETVKYLTSFTFSVSLFVGYDNSDITVKIGAKTLTAASGIYTVDAADVVGNIHIVVEGVVANNYTAQITTVPADKFNSSYLTAQTTTYQTGFTFIVEVLFGYTNSTPSATITVDGETYTLADPLSLGENRYRFSVSGDYVTDAISISIGGITNNKYTVNHSKGTGYAVGGALEATYNTAYTFSVSIDASHSQSAQTYAVQVTVGGSVVDAVKDGNSYTISASDVDGNIEVLVSGVNLNTYTAQISTAQEDKFTSSYSVAQTISHNTAFAFSITLKEGYTDSAISAKAKVGVTEYSLAAPTLTAANTYTFNVPANIVLQNVELIINGITANAYSVSKPDLQGLTITAPNTVYYLTSFEFTAELKDSHNQSDIVVLVNGTEIVAEADGVTYVVAASLVTGNITITISGLELNEYAFAINETAGVVYNGITNPTTIDHGISFSFKIKLDVGYTKSVPVASIAGGTTLGAGTEGANNIWTFTVPGNLATQAIVINMTVLVNTYDVDLPSPVGYSIVQGDSTVDHSMAAEDVYTFSIKVGAAYMLNSNPALTNIVGGAIKETQHTAGSDIWTFIIGDIVGDLSFDVTGIIKNVYTVVLTNGEGYSISGAATVIDGNNYTATITLDPSHTQTEPKISVNGGELISKTSGNNPYQFVLTGVDSVLADATGKITITVSVQRNSYEVTGEDGVGYQFVTQELPVNKLHDQTLTFYVKVAAAYNLSEPVVFAGSVVALNYDSREYVDNTWVYTYTTTVTKAFEITVSVVKNSYDIAVAINGQGIAAVTGEGLAVAEHGADYGFTVKLETSHSKTMPTVIVSGVAGTLTGTEGENNVWTFAIPGEYVTQNRTIAVSATRNTYTVELPAGGDGWTSYIVSETVQHGNDYVFYIELSASHSKSVPTVAGATYDGRNGSLWTFIIENVTENKTISQNDVGSVVRNQYTITFTASANGEVSSLVSTVEHGGNVVVNISPDRGYRIARLVVNGTATEVSGDIRTITNVTSDLTIYGEFEALPLYKIYFYSNDGTESVQILEGLEGDTPLASAINLPTRAGYFITGWATSSNGALEYGLDLDGIVFEEGDGLKYYAYWGQAINYYISLSPSIGDIIDTAGRTNNYVSIGKEVYLFVSETYTTAGWEVKIGDSDTWYLLGVVGRIINLNDIITENFLQLYREENTAAVDGYMLTFRPMLEAAAVVTHTVTANISPTSYGTVVAIIEDSTKSTLTNGVPTQILEGKDIKIIVTPNQYHQIASLKVDGVEWTDIVDYQDIFTIGGDGSISWNVLAIALDVEIDVVFELISYAFNVVTVNDLNKMIAPDVQGPGSSYIVNPYTTITYGSVMVLSLAPIQPNNYKFVNYWIMDNIINMPEIISPELSEFGRAYIVVDDTFLEKFLSGGTVTVVAEYAVTQNFSIEFNAGSELNGEIYVDYWDGGFGDFTSLNDPTLSSGHTFNYNTQLKIFVEPYGGYSIDSIIDLNTMQDIRDMAVLGLTYDQGVYTFYLVQDLDIQITLKASYYNVILQSVDLDGNEIAGYQQQEWTDIQADGSDNIISNINIKTDGYYKFVSWYFMIGVNKIPFKVGDYADNISFDQYGNITSLTIAGEFAKEVSDASNQIILIAEYSEEMRLIIEISDTIGDNANEYELWVDDIKIGTFNSATDEVLSFGRKIKIVPVAAKYYLFSYYTGLGDIIPGANNAIEFTLEGAKIITLNFIPEPVALSITTDTTGANGTLEITINGEKLSSIAELDRLVKIGDVIVIRFDASNGYEFDNMKIGNGENSASLVNGKSIIVTKDWLDEWVTLGALSLNVSVETHVSTGVLAGILATCIVVPLILIATVIYIVAIRRKKNDYKLAMERSQQNETRLKSMQQLDDLIKDVKESKDEE